MYNVRMKNEVFVNWKVKVLLALVTVHCSLYTSNAQRVLSLDSCRAMALRSNKQMDVSRLKQDVAKNIRKSVRTKYLPHISAIGTYQHTTEEISLLSDEQKASLSNLGNTVGGMLQGPMGRLDAGLGNVQSGIGTVSSTLTALGLPAPLTTQLGNDLQQMRQDLANGAASTTGLLNAEGQKIVDAFHTDTRNVWAGSIMAIQPVFMGGSIIAMNKLADLNEEMAMNSAEARQQLVIYSVDKAYWQVVSLRHKKALAESYLAVVQKLNGDVEKMIAEGVATKSDGLSVSVKLNEVEMTVQKVNDGLTLSRMLLCQMIGLPTNEDVVLVDESLSNSLTPDPSPKREGSEYQSTLKDGNEYQKGEGSEYQSTLKERVEAALITPLSFRRGDGGEAFSSRPELKMLDNSVAMSKQVTNILKAGNLPMVALMGGYSVSNPSVMNGFEKKFKGFWNVGVLMRVPLWNWGDVTYKVRASKGATAIATLEMEEVREKIELQVNQSAFKVEEAGKRLRLADSSVEKAEENLRMANLGFQEGVITPATVMEAQTAWLQARSQQIDAQIDVLMSNVDLKKAQGILGIDN
jgi:outer membrane protein TolC